MTTATGKSFRRNPRHLAAVREIAAGRVLLAADRITATTRTLLQQPGSGVQHRGQPRRSSAPGQPPTSQTGLLAASQRSYGPVVRPTSVVAASGSDYWKEAVFVQVGTAKAAPRPYMLPGLLASQRDVLEAFSEGGVS